jgi:hypothetical protein
MKKEHTRLHLMLGGLLALFLGLACGFVAIRSIYTSGPVGLAAFEAVVGIYLGEFLLRHSNNKEYRE